MLSSGTIILQQASASNCGLYGTGAALIDNGFLQTDSRGLIMIGGGPGRGSMPPPRYPNGNLTAPHNSGDPNIRIAPTLRRLARIGTASPAPSVTRAKTRAGGALLSSMIKYDEPSQEQIMAEIERMTITLPADMASAIRGAVEGGGYASSSEVVREALRDWKLKRSMQIQELAALKADIDRGLADVAEGRVKDFDASRIIERGRLLLAGRSASA